MIQTGPEYDHPETDEFLQKEGRAGYPADKTLAVSLVFIRLLMKQIDFFYFLILIFFAGTPPTISYGGTSFVTTAPAPTIAPFPIVMPGIMITR